MAMHDYAVEVLGNRSNLRLLKTLVRYRGKVFTVRELARTAGMSHPEASLVLRNMEKRGIVTLQPVGKAYQVGLNEESYILKSVIEPLFKAEENTLKAFISSIRSFFDERKIVSVAIFGSVARGTEKITSDVDVLVVTDDAEFGNQCVAKANIRSVAKFGFALSPLIVSRARLVRERNTDLVKSILDSYSMVVGKDLAKVVQNIEAS